jgi:hypothetical protein
MVLDGKEREVCSLGGRSWTWTYQGYYVWDKKPTLDEVVAKMKEELIDYVMDGVVPLPVDSYSELHDYFDANCLAGMEQLWCTIGPDESTTLFNEASNIVDAWIKCGYLIAEYQKVEAKRWIPSNTSVENDRKEWLKFVLDEFTQIFNNPHCAGYWLYGVKFEQQLGWLAYECGDDPVYIDHSDAVALWLKGAALPDRYFRLDIEFANKSFDNGTARWGRNWKNRSDGDLGDIDNLVQWTLLGEIHYG